MLTSRPPGLGTENAGVPSAVHLAVHPRREPRAADWFRRLQRNHGVGEWPTRIFTASREEHRCRPALTAAMDVLRRSCRAHARGPRSRSRAGRRMAAGIPGARFVASQGATHLFPRDPSRLRPVPRATPRRFLAARPGPPDTHPGGRRYRREGGPIRHGHDRRPGRDLLHLLHPPSMLAGSPLSAQGPVGVPVKRRLKLSHWGGQHHSGVLSSRPEPRVEVQLCCFDNKASR